MKLRIPICGGEFSGTIFSGTREAKRGFLRSPYLQVAQNQTT